MATILILDDERIIVQAIRHHLEQEAHTVLVASSADDGLELFTKHDPKLVILDVMLPMTDGWQICRRLRAISQVPILVLSARSGTEEKVRALTLGADDYVTKPCQLPELMARIKALLRRSTATASQAEAQPHFDDGHLRIDFERRRVWVAGRAIRLSPLEFRLLVCLVQRPGRVVTRSQLLSYVWGPECVYGSSYVKLYIKYLRDKIEPDPAQPRYIRTEWGVGYYFDQPASPSLPHPVEAVPWSQAVGHAS